MTRPSWQDYGTHDESAYPELWDGVVGAWCPSLGPTGLRLHDNSRYNNWGTLTNMDAATDWVVDGGQYALDFDGTNDVVSVPRQPQIYNSANLGTISAWVYSRDYDGSDGGSPRTNFNDIIGPDTIWGTREWVVSTIATGGITTTAKLGVGIFGSGGGILAAETTNRVLTTNAWLHIAITRTAMSFGGLAIYLNGVQQILTDTSSGTFNTPNSSTTQALTIGRRTGQLGTQDLHWNGQIDDIALYSRALSANEIQRLYLLGRGGMYERRRRTLRRVAIEQGATFNARWARRQNQIIGGGV